MKIFRFKYMGVVPYGRFSMYECSSWTEALAEGLRRVEKGEYLKEVMLFKP